MWFVLASRSDACAQQNSCVFQLVAHTCSTKWPSTSRESFVRCWHNLLFLKSTSSQVQNGRTMTTGLSFWLNGKTTPLPTPHFSWALSLILPCHMVASEDKAFPRLWWDREVDFDGISAKICRAAHMPSKKTRPFASAYNQSIPHFFPQHTGTVLSCPSFQATFSPNSPPMENFSATVPWSQSLTLVSVTMT